MTANTLSNLSNRYRFFLWASAFLVLINLFVMNDWMPLWAAWETLNLQSIQEASGGLGLPQRVTSWWIDPLQTNLFILRLPGVLLLLLSLTGAYFLAKPIFGHQTSLHTGLVLSTSFALLFCSKLFVSDTWLFAVQLLSLLAQLRFLKKPSLPNGLLFWLPVLVGLMIHPWSVAIAAFVFGTYLRVLHPQGKRLDKLGFWILPLAFLLSTFQRTGFILAYGELPYWKYVLVILGGFFPWTGFMVASFGDLLYKFRKREEMAIIIGGLLLAGLLAQSLILALPLALLIARQITAYFQKNYPYKTLARAFSILHLLASFFIVTLLLLTAYSSFGGLGFRAIMTTGAVYWMLTLIGVIGFFGDYRRLVLGGIVGGALLGFFLFWVRTYPVFMDFFAGME